MLRALLAILIVSAFPYAARAQPRTLDVLSIYRDVNEMCRSWTDNDLHRVAA